MYLRLNHVTCSIFLRLDMLQAIYTAIPTRTKKPTILPTTIPAIATDDMSFLQPELSPQELYTLHRMDLSIHRPLVHLNEPCGQL